MQRQFRRGFWDFFTKATRILVLNDAEILCEFLDKGKPHIERLEYLKSNSKSIKKLL